MRRVIFACARRGFFQEMPTEDCAFLLGATSDGRSKPGSPEKYLPHVRLGAAACRYHAPVSGAIGIPICGALGGFDGSTWQFFVSINQLGSGLACTIFCVAHPFMCELPSSLLKEES